MVGGICAMTEDCVLLLLLTLACMRSEGYCSCPVCLCVWLLPHFLPLSSILCTSGLCTTLTRYIKRRFCNFVYKLDIICFF